MSDEQLPPESKLWKWRATSPPQVPVESPQIPVEPPHPSQPSPPPSEPQKWSGMGTSSDRFRALPLPYWFEDKSVGSRPPGVLCDACCRVGSILWAFRGRVDQDTHFLWRCTRCVYTPQGYIAVQGHLARSHANGES